MARIATCVTIYNSKESCAEMCNLSRGIAEENSVRSAIDTYREVGMKGTDILTRIIERFKLTDTQAKEYMAESRSVAV